MTPAEAFHLLAPHLAEGLEVWQADGWDLRLVCANATAGRFAGVDLGASTGLGEIRKAGERAADVPRARVEGATEASEARAAAEPGDADSSLVHETLLEPGSRSLQKPLTMATFASRVRVLLDEAAPSQ